MDVRLGSENRRIAERGGVAVMRVASGPGHSWRRSVRTLPWLAGSLHLEAASIIANMTHVLQPTCQLGKVDRHFGECGPIPGN